MELIETNHVIFGKESDRNAVLQTLSDRVVELGYSKVDLVPDFLRREEFRFHTQSLTMSYILEFLYLKVKMK